MMDRRDAPEGLEISAGGLQYLWRRWSRKVMLYLFLLTLAGAMFLAFHEDPPRGGLKGRPPEPWLHPTTTMYLIFGGGILFAFIFFRISLAWRRLAQLPARMMARGDAAGAERAYERALARARAYRASDFRRGAMLYELAGYVGNQGRYPEAEALFEESIEFLADKAGPQRAHYFCALNNLAVLLLHKKDYPGAQRLFEKALVLIPTMKRNAPSLFLALSSSDKYLEFVLHLNLSHLAVQVKQLDEARWHLEQADVVLRSISRLQRRSVHDYCLGCWCEWKCAAGLYEEAWDDCARARDPNHAAILFIRARVELARKNYPQAEKFLRKRWEAERKKGTLHRPDLLASTLVLAESLLGQGKHVEAFAALQEARSIVADFGIPRDAGWAATLRTWLEQAQQLARSADAAALEQELGAIPTMTSTAVIALDRFRIRLEEDK
jgi:tetratricopeptide (TPR) repeat protein